ncbi:hypothetical protein DSUL_80047 [Desulfovibrionales bacterium]
MYFLSKRKDLIMVATCVGNELYIEGVVSYFFWCRCSVFLLY